MYFILNYKSAKGIFFSFDIAYFKLYYISFHSFYEGMFLSGDTIRVYLSGRIRLHSSWMLLSIEGEFSRFRRNWSICRFTVMFFVVTLLRIKLLRYFSILLLDPTSCCSYILLPKQAIKDQKI